MIATWLKPLLSSAVRIAPTRPSIMSDGATISAPARARARVRQRRARQQFERRVIVDVVATERAAMPVVGVLAHADVGDHGQSGHAFLDFADRALHFAVVVPCLAAHRVLAFGNSKQDYGGDAGRPGLARF